MVPVAQIPEKGKRKLNICPRFHSISLKFVCFEVILQKKLLAINFPEAKVVKHFFGCIVKQVSWFKSSLLLRIKSNTHTNYNFFIKTRDSIFNRKLYTTDERRRPSVAWLGFLTDSILIKEKHKHLF
jgi:hypothetical protein